MIRRALEAYLRAKEAAALDDLLEAGYRAHPEVVDDDLIAGQSWPIE